MPQLGQAKACPTSSERYMSSDLDDTLAGGGAGDCSGSGIGQHTVAVADVGVRVRIVHVVKDVEHVGPEFQKHLLMEGEFLADAEVGVVETRPNQVIASRVAKGPIGRV